MTAVLVVFLHYQWFFLDLVAFLNISASFRFQILKKGLKHEIYIGSVTFRLLTMKKKQNFKNNTRLASPLAWV